MARTFPLPFILVLTTTLTYSQIAKEFMIGGGADLVKTDNDGFVKKAQIAIEGNYFLTRQFTATAGFDIWTGDGISAVIGGRWYPTEYFFTRIRGLIGENDISIGAGWNKPITKSWYFEAMGDFYFEGEFGIRVGTMYFMGR